VLTLLEVEVVKASQSAEYCSSAAPELVRASSPCLETEKVARLFGLEFIAPTVLQFLEKLH
jgi:hypothetical protein